MIARRVVATLALLLCACVGTEGGNPIQPEIDGEKVSIQATDESRMELVGEAGAVTPALASVRYLDLEGTDGFSELVTNDDGSFFVVIEGDSTHRFRLRALLESERSEAIDVQPRGFGGPLPPSCVTYETDFEFMEDGESFVWRVQNDCVMAVDTMAPSLRFETGAFTFDDPGAQTLMPGEFVDLTVTRRGNGPVEDTLVFGTTDGPAAVTLLER